MLTSLLSIVKRHAMGGANAHVTAPSFERIRCECRKDNFGAPLLHWESRKILCQARINCDAFEDAAICCNSAVKLAHLTPATTSHTDKNHSKSAENPVKTIRDATYIKNRITI